MREVVRSVMVRVGLVSQVKFRAGGLVEVISSCHPLYSSQRCSEVASLRPGGFAFFTAQRCLSAGLLCPALLLVLSVPLVNETTVPVREFLDGEGC